MVLNTRIAFWWTGRRVHPCASASAGTNIDAGRTGRFARSSLAHAKEHAMKACSACSWFFDRAAYGPPSAQLHVSVV